MIENHDEILGLWSDLRDRMAGVEEAVMRLIEAGACEHSLKASVANNASRRRHREVQAASVKGRRTWKEWTFKEEQTLLELGAVDASKVLNRTFYACKQRLWALNNNLSKPLDNPSQVC